MMAMIDNDVTDDEGKLEQKACDASAFTSPSSLCSYYRRVY